MNAQVSIIPKPEKIDIGKGKWKLKRNSVIAYSTVELKPAATYLQQTIEKLTGYRLHIKQATKGNIVLKTNNDKNYYTLKVKSNGVEISAPTYEGIVCGIGTLRQILSKNSIPCLEIVDNPRMEWRGFHLDCSRHFFTTDEVKEVIDLMSMYKLNRFHWHLTDDQGWRVEVKRYPLLTTKGAWRTLNNQDSVCLQMAKDEDNPDMLLPNDRFKVIYDETKQEKETRLYGGFYSQEEIKNIIVFAKQRGIEIVPEIDMPGHMLAAIDCYEGLSCFENPGWGKVFTSPLCPGKDKVLEFCKNVWDEVSDLFPFEYVHIGGDEVEKDNWIKCDDCQKRISTMKLRDEKELQSWFLHEMEKYINSKGKKMIGWDEILEGGLSETSTVMWWRTWEPTAVKQAASHGNDVILTPMSPFYLSAKPEVTSVEQIYNYDIYQGELTSEEQHHILGVQGNLWGEWIPSRERVMYMYFPRIIAVAELAWTNVSNKNYDDFKQRINYHYEMLHRIGVPYRTPDLKGFLDVNAFVNNAILTVKCDDPTATIRYTTDGSCPTKDSPIYTNPILVDETTLFTLRAFSPSGRADAMQKVSFVKQGLLEPVAISHSLRQGLQADWYDFKGNTCKKITTARLNGTYTINDIEIPKEANGNIGLVITGYISVQEDGIYTFALKSDDGSWLKIDGNMVVDNDREQSPHEMIGQQALHKGLHKIEVRYFDYNGGMLQMKVTSPSNKQLQAKDIFWY